MDSSRGNISPCTGLLDLLRVLPAEREFLLGEIISGTVKDIHSPPQTPKPDGKVTLSDDKRQEMEGTSSHKAFVEKNPDECNRRETEEEQEDYFAHWAGFLFLCGFGGGGELGAEYKCLDDKNLKAGVVEEQEEETQLTEASHQLTFEASDHNVSDGLRRMEEFFDVERASEG